MSEAPSTAFRQTLQEREDAYSSRQGEISRTDAERKERLRAFKVSEQEYKRLQANLKPIVAAQKKADKEAAKRKAQKGKVEKQEAKRKADAEKTQKKVDKKEEERSECQNALKTKGKSIKTN